MPTRTSSFRLASLLLVALLGLVGPATTHAVPNSSEQPVVAVVLPAPDGTMLSWTPVAGATSYNVYGITNGGGEQLLTATPDTSITVDATHARYAVAAVVDGNEGPRTVAAEPICIDISGDVPPTIDVRYDCGALSGLGVKIRTY